VSLFSVDDRDRARDRVLDLAVADQRVVAGAVVGSLALDDGDRWSDLDLTFAVADERQLPHVLADWTRAIVADLDAVQLFDVSAGDAVYRVFVLPGCLQLDLSFAPAASFGALGPKFRLLFGSAVERPFPRPPSVHELFGFAVHHALRARFCIERGRYWHAEYWLSGLRDHALHLACVRRGLRAVYGRGFDDLPTDVRGSFGGALVRSLDRDELLRALGSAIDGLLRESAGVEELREPAAKVEPRLRALV
jgi:hypothetical protein